MPSPKAGTVTSNIQETLTEFQKGKFEYKTDKMGIAHISFGKSDFNDNKLKENLIAVYKSIKQNRPLGIKGKYFKNLFICSTMGPSIEIDVKSFEVKSLYYN
jgi:large subunit ribosomal protein L1